MWSHPKIKFESVGESEYDECMDWLATLRMYQVDPDGLDADYNEDDPPSMIVGECEFLTIRLGEGNVAMDSLDQFDDDCMVFAELFEGSELSWAVEREYDPPSDAVVVRSVWIDKRFRGRNLGAHLLAEVLARMVHLTAYVAALAASMEEGAGQTEAGSAAAARKLADHWLKVGLRPVELSTRQTRDGVLVAAHGGFKDLADARSALGDFDLTEVTISGPAGEVAEQQRQRLNRGQVS